MPPTQDQNKLLSVLEDTANLLRKSQTNLKKCPKTRLTKGYIEARLCIIEDYWQTFKNAHQDLVKITPTEMKGVLPYFLNEEFFIYEDLYNVLQGDLKDMLTAMTELSNIESRSINMSGDITQVQNNVVHLPKIQLPSFNGTYDEWPTFKDLFTSLVHNNPSLSSVQKLHYLKTSVTSEAESLLRHIRVTADNYQQAWDVLQARYGNKRLILNSTMRRLFNQKKMTSQSAVQLKGLLDTTCECINNLNNLNISTDSWDSIIIYLLVQKLDPETHRSWEEYSYKKECEELPTYKEFKMFLETKFRVNYYTLELITSSTKEIKTVKERSYHVTATTTNNITRCCVMCKDNHTLCHCKDFIKLEPSERSNYVKTNQLCYNCLAPGHSAFKCKLNMSCRICKRRHHSLLHTNKSLEPAVPSSTPPPQVSTHVVEEGEEEVQVHTMMTSHHSTRQNMALLATAVVEATNDRGQTIPLRALIDPGSQATFISEKAAQMLKLKRRPMTGCVLGVGSTRAEIKHEVQLEIKSRLDHSFSIPIQAYVMSKQLTTKIPTKTIQSSQHWPHLHNLTLADPNFHEPGAIDLLLGVKEYAKIIQENIIRGPPGTPSAQRTHFGWIIFGDICTKEKDHTYVVLHHQVNIDEMLKRLWEIDHNQKRNYTEEEKLCENIYETTTSRNEKGRYIVKLPFKTEDLQSPKGNLKEIAIQRFKLLEKRFRRIPDLKEEYSKVINEYITEEHMESIPEMEKNKENTVYLPHHAVVRTDKETSQTRVVFDASQKGTNHVSLNDELLVGPQLQEDLRNILMRWRSHKICFVADVTKMYRQILVTKEDADLQRIVWRNNDTDDLQEYRLLRVTFGTAAAPYLAVRTLFQVANDEGSNHTLASKTIKEDFFMDDVLSGADSVTEAQVLAKEIKDILQKGGFQLTKWTSNSIEFTKSIDEKERSVKAHVDLNLDGIIKALGVVWNLSTDTFQYHINILPIDGPVTKREILSDLQKLFDPLGWIAPSTVMAKILIQKLWLERIGWDERINETLEEEWKQIRSDFIHTKEIEIQRWLGTHSTDKDKIQIHGFSDASMRAYAASVYIRVEKADGTVETKLIAAKTRVAPLKVISLPRLELCGAVLLAKLMTQVSNAMRIPASQMHAWTDSTIVIAWLSGEPNRWKSFVANRVVEILENVDNKHWHHVQSHENPADLGSRGMLLSELKKCELWWKGPRWLSEKEININIEEVVETDLEKKTMKINTHLNVDTVELEKTLHSQFDKFDNLPELLKTLTYCKRFMGFKSNRNDQNLEFTTDEIEETLIICIKKAQEFEFKEEIEQLSLKKQVKNKSSLKSFNPCLDEKNILRVGGRLRHSQLPDDRKNPIILGHDNLLTPLIIADAHKKTLHGGIQQMLYYLRMKYWIVKAKLLVKKYIHRCYVCRRINAIAKQQIMGDLPRERVTPSRPFLHSGVDFAGPFQILASKGRGNRSVKSYIAIFICLSTKAIHIELVGDLTTEAFIGAFRRFVARRGKCSHLWSDQGRNFVGAAKELKDTFKEAKLEFSGDIASTLATDEGTQWHFIPAYSPNFGGLWEAGVKSIKYHLKRILTSNLTYEEMTTVLCQIESCLNSRPLWPVDENIESIDVLTPGHFLIGEAPIVVPHPDMKNIKVNTLSRWQHTQKLFGEFWRRWQDEYLSRLQQRPKWMNKKDEFHIGDIVLIKTENLPPGKWSLGRITEKHPGADGCTRVYSVKSGNSIVKRSVTKLCALPIDSE